MRRSNPRSGTRAERSNSTTTPRWTRVPRSPSARRSPELARRMRALRRCALGLRPPVERTARNRSRGASSISITPTGRPAACAKPARLRLPQWTEVRHLGLQWAYGPTLLGNAADKLFLLGRWDEARVFLDEASPFVVGGMAGGDLRNVEADLAIGEGRFAEAAAFLDDAFEMVRHVKSWNTLSPLWYSQLDLSIWRRDWERADAALAEGLAGIPDSDRMIYVPRYGRPRDAPPRRGGPGRAGESGPGRAECTTRSRTIARRAARRARPTTRRAPGPGPARIHRPRARRAACGCSERPRRRPGGQPAEAFDEVGMAGTGCVRAVARGGSGPCRSN